MMVSWNTGMMQQTKRMQYAVEFCNMSIIIHINMDVKIWPNTKNSYFADA